MLEGLSSLNTQFWLRQSLSHTLLLLFLHSVLHFYRQLLSEAWHGASYTGSLKQYGHVYVFCISWYLNQMLYYSMHGEFLLLNLPVSDVLLLLLIIKLDQYVLLTFSFCPSSIQGSKLKQPLFSSLDGKWYLPGQLKSLGPQNSLTLLILSVKNNPWPWLSPEQFLQCWGRC